MDESSFESELNESPNDGALLRRYAEWLGKHGDSRAELLQCEIDRRDAANRLRNIEDRATSLAWKFGEYLDWLDRVMPNFVLSPTTGTFYSAPRPDAEPYVTLDAYCSADTIVGIVESMKLFNEIPAVHAGVVAEIFVDNESKVELGQPLFRISRPPTLLAGG